MRIEFSGTAQQIALVTSLAEDIYKLYAYYFDSSYKIIHRGHYCIGMSRDLIKFLDIEGIRGQLLISPHQRYLPYHTFVGLDNDWIADPTWQQFVASYFPIGKASKILIERRTRLTEILTRYEVPYKLHPVWIQGVLPPL